MLSFYLIYLFPTTWELGTRNIDYMSIAQDSQTLKLYTRHLQLIQYSYFSLLSFTGWETLQMQAQTTYHFDVQGVLIPRTSFDEVLAVVM